MAKLTLRDITKMKDEKDPIACCTAFDFAGIHIAEEAEIDVLIPGDWAMGTTVLGHPTAIPVEMKHVLFYLHAVVRTAKRGFIVAPMPYGSYQISNRDAVTNATTLMKAGAESIKLEGGGCTIERVQALSEVGVPCLGHLGYTPQYVKILGDERVVGAKASEAAQIVRDVRALEDAGAWGVILQNVPDRVTECIIKKTNLITIGAGGTRGCDGYLVLTHDLVGSPQTVNPLYSIQYGNFLERGVAALNKHCEEVRALEFPTEKHTFKIPDEAYDQFIKEIDRE